jgi:hypothetical protein
MEVREHINAYAMMFSVLSYLTLSLNSSERKKS